MQTQQHHKLQENFSRVQKPKQKEEIVQNEIRITSLGKTRSYITCATTVLGEKKFDSVILKAMGRAINKAVTISEIIRRRVADIHQITDISSHEIVDEWEPKEQGQSKISTKRNVSSITITLSTKQLDTKSVGYQKPLPKDQVVEEEKKEIREKKEHVKKEFVKREPREPREPREHKEPREPREHREPRPKKEVKDVKEEKDERGSDDTRGRGRGGRGGARARGRGRGGRGVRGPSRGQSEQQQ
jgi:DNA-binding protein Alba